MSLEKYQPIQTVKTFTPLYINQNPNYASNYECFYFIFTLHLQRERQSWIYFTLFFVAETSPNLTVEKPSIMEGTKNK